MHDTRLARLNSLGAGGGWGEIPRKNDGDARSSRLGVEVTKFWSQFGFSGRIAIFCTHIPKDVTLG